MRREENGNRITQMQKVALQIIKVNSIFREADQTLADNGIHIHFLNNKKGLRVHNASDFQSEFNKLYFGGWTNIGGALRTKILDPLVRQTETADRKTKPLLIVIITDGKVGLPDDEDVSNNGRSLQWSSRSLRIQSN